MKKGLLLIFVFSTTLLFASFTDQLENGDGWANHSSGNWTESATAGVYTGHGMYANGGDANSGSRKIGFNDVGDWFEFPAVDNPSSMSYEARLSSNTSGTNSLKVQVFNGGVWVDVIEHTATINTYVSFSADLSAYNALLGVKIRLYRSADNKSHYVDDISVVTGVLPITLTSFSGREKNNGINLSWTTAQEINNKFFSIERANADKSFTGIGKVKGLGDSNTFQNYSFIDVAPLNGSNLYRLKQTDIDGAFTYSDVIVVEVRNGNEPSLIPSLVDDMTTITFNNAIESDIRFIIFNINGQMIYSNQIKAGSVSFEINTIDFAKGSYFVKFDDKSISTIRFIKL